MFFVPKCLVLALMSFALVTHELSELSVKYGTIYKALMITIYKVHTSELSEYFSVCTKVQPNEQLKRKN